MKKLIKRLEEQAVENERLSTENTELRKELLQEVKDKVFNELDKEERPKTTSSYEELGSQDFKKGENKELEEAKEYLSGYAKGAYPIKRKLKKSIDTILKHLEK